MRKRVLALLCALAVAGTSPNVLPALQVSAAETTAVGTTYYISSIHGDNSKDGKSENTAWETLDKLSGITLQPGDQVLLEKVLILTGIFIWWMFMEQSRRRSKSAVMVQEKKSRVFTQMDRDMVSGL